VRTLDIETGIKIIVLMAIALELFALYRHSKLDNKMDKHIVENTRNLKESEQIILNMNAYIMKVDEHMLKLDKHINRYDKHVVILNEHINRLDDLIMKTYSQNPKKINNPSKSHK
jgi:hypothetical protein